MPPWVGYNEEETIQQQILALSAVSVTPHKMCPLIKKNSTPQCNFKQNVTSVCCFICRQDKRNFLRDPPAGVQFHFDCEQMYPVAMVMLEEDELLRKMRFHLVPKQ